MKLYIGRQVQQYVNIDELGEQARELSEGKGRIQGFLAQLLEHEPFLPIRIRVIVEWAGASDPNAFRSPEWSDAGPAQSMVSQRNLAK